MRGASFVLVVCKGTFVLTPTTASIGGTQEPIHENDQRWDDKPDRSVLAPCDIVPFKRDVDVVLVGHAFSPGGQAVRSIMTRLCVGDIDKSIEVFGDRLFTPHGELRDGPRITRARLRYERAAGGPGTSNPVGMRHDKKDLFGAIALASLQPPGLYVTRPDDLVEPLGYGPIAPEWPTRASRLGHWATTFSPTHWYDAPLPDDIDPSFFNVAPPDQRLREVRPDERIMLEGLTADQTRFVTQLPSLMPHAVIERATGRRESLSLRADTLWIDSSRRICTVTYRATVPLAHPSDTGRIVVTLGAPPETSRVFARLDPALLAMPMIADHPDGGDTISVNFRGKSRPVTPFDVNTISEPETMDLLPDDPAFVGDDAITFVQSDDMKSNTLPFVAAHHASADRGANLPPPPAFDTALPFASRQRAPSSPGLPFVTAPASALSPAPAKPPPITPAPLAPRDLPFLTPTGPSAKSASGVFPPPSAPPPVFPVQAPPPSAPPPVFPVPASVPMAASFASIASVASFSKPNTPLATPPPPPVSLDTTPEAPPMIGPLATPAMFARGTHTSTSELVPVPTEAKQIPTAPAPQTPIEDDSIERCARITASITRRRDDRAKILDAEKLEAERFVALQTRWNTAISAETDKGKTKLLDKFDDAYVGRLEEERGVIRPDEFARLVVAAERGHSDITLRELGLPPSALMRIERVFLRRTARDQDLAQRVLRAIDAERDA